MNRPRKLAKLSAPRLFGVVERPRLFSRLDENRGRPLIWIDSPPGSGKTSLVASYLEARAIPAIWYTVDAADEDPASVFHYLTVAARSENRDAVLPRFTPESQSAGAAFARLFFRALFAALPEGEVVVFDNYQELSASSPIHDALIAGVSQVPPGSSLVCISRAAAPPGYVRLAASGLMCALHWESLQLTLDETRHYVLSRSLADDELVRRLHVQSDGWAAGITLMLERVGQEGPNCPVPATDAREATFDYFAALILDRLAGEAAQVLLCVAFLPYASAEMAVALTGCSGAGEVLLDLHRTRLFVDRRPGVPPVYVFHALFRDFLQSRARERLGTDRVTEVLQRCAEVLEANQDSEAAIPLRIAARDWSSLTGALLRLAEHVLETGRHDTLEQWIAAIPEMQREREPLLLYWQGMGRARSGSVTGIRLIEQALERFEESGDRERQLLCLTALLRIGYVMAYAGMQSMDRWLGALLDRVPDHRPLQVSARLELRIWASLCSALMLIRPWHPWVEIAAGRVLALIERDAERTEVVPAATAAVDLAVNRGDMDACEKLVAQLEPLLRPPHTAPTDVSWAWYQLGYLRLFQARYEQAWECAERARGVAEENGLSMLLVQATAFRAMVEYRGWGWGRAGATLQVAEAMPQPTHALSIGYMNLLKARRALAGSRLSEAAESADQAYRMVAGTGSAHQRMVWGVSCGDVLLAAHRLDQARALFRESREILDDSLSMHDSHRAMICLAEAFLAHEEGSREVELQRLRDALLLAQEHNRRYFLRYLDVGMQRMFAVALEHGLYPEFVRELIRMFRLTPPAHAPSSWPWPIRIDTLGRFDVSVHDQPLEFSRKLPRKTLALLKIIIAYGGQNVTEESICDALWPDDEADAAREALKITVIRLRKLLGTNEAVVQQGGKLSLDRNYVWVDVWSFERDVKAADEDKVRAALELYRGQFLPEDASAPWTVTARERLRGRFMHALAAQGAAMELQACHEQAESLYLQGIDADPIVEMFHQGLMRCYQAQGRHLEAISVYRRMRQMLSAVLGVAPSEASRQLYESSARALGNGAAQDLATNVLPMPKGRRQSPV